MDQPWVLAESPGTLASVAEQQGPFSIYAAFYEFAHLRSWQSPLFPDVGSKPAQYPVVELIYECARSACAKIGPPAAHVVVDPAYDLTNALPAFPGCKSSDFLPESF